MIIFILCTLKLYCGLAMNSSDSSLTKTMETLQKTGLATAIVKLV